jgi:hypothetical protein
MRIIWQHRAGFRKKSVSMVGWIQTKRKSFGCIFVMDVTENPEWREFQMKSPGFDGLFLGRRT